MPACLSTWMMQKLVKSWFQCKESPGEVGGGGGRRATALTHLYLLKATRTTKSLQGTKLAKSSSQQFSLMEEIEIPYRYNKINPGSTYSWIGLLIAVSGLSEELKSLVLLEDLQRVQGWRTLSVKHTAEPLVGALAFLLHTLPILLLVFYQS